MSKGIVFAGDLHAARTIYVTHPNMTGDSQFALRQITDFCRENSMPLCLCGDNFNKRYPEPEIVAWFLELLAGLDVYYIVGQHDLHRGAQWPEIEAGAAWPRRHLGAEPRENSCFEVSGIKLYGFDFLPRTKLEERLKQVPEDCEILCMHGLIKDVMGIEEAWHLDMEWVPEHVKVTVLGDWHGIPQDGETAGRKWLYTGSSSMQSVTEPTAKTFLVCRRTIDIDSSKLKGAVNTKALCFERIPLRTRPYIFGDVRYENELAEWCSKIKATCERAHNEALGREVPDEVARPFVVLRYSVGIKDAYRQIMDALGPLIETGDVYYHPLPNRAFVPEGEDGNVLDKQVSVDGAIGELVDRELAPELHALVTDLAHAADPKEVVHGFKHRHEVINNPVGGGGVTV